MEDRRINPELIGIEMVRKRRYEIEAALRAIQAAGVPRAKKKPRVLSRG